MCRCSGTAGVLIFLSAEPVSSQLVTCRCSGIRLGTFGVNLRLQQPPSQRLVHRASRPRRTGSALLWAGLGKKTSVIFGYIMAIIRHDGVQEKDRQCLVKVWHNVDPTWIGWRTHKSNLLFEIILRHVMCSNHLRMTPAALLNS